MATRKKSSFTFESGMAQLEALTDQIGAGDLPLEETIRLYEQGMALCTRLENELNGLQKRIEQIDLDTAEITAFEEKEYGV